MEFIAKTLGRPWPPTPTDAPPSAGAGALPTGLSRRTRGNNKRCVNEGLHQSGYTFRVPSYRDGYPAICAEYLANLP
jgi:hypothetical protein